ncbi:related to HCM1 - Forkhead transcription factor [Ustilago trichophora]|uniref:Related to HCM1 - Forkhead transcription factor n=1 Tax=Ustilago trichophora TaxID=86804 RepID=A0A5C3E542_9BASI|nr:related to HCM1 - Forkhead transcription factor [Ustilago trichophora]
MYLSQPRDLISSMSAGCSRGTTLLAHRDNLAMLPTAKADPSSLQRKTIKVSAADRSLSTDRDYARMHDASPSTSLPSFKQPDPSHRISLDYTSKTDSLSVVVSSSESRSMSRWFRSQHFQNVWQSLDPGNSETRPPHPYTELIKLCILKQREGKLTLNQLYHDLEEKFPFFAASAKGKGWKNTLRHNLSTQPYFIKLDREHGQLGKGHYWAYCPDLEKPTSLAQSSVVQLSNLWSSSVSAVSVPPREDSARNFCSATEFQHVPSPETLRASTSSTALPRFDQYDLRQGNMRPLPRLYRNPTHQVTQDEAPQVVGSLVPMRRLSSPVRNFRPLPHHNDPSLSHSHPQRLRSATISTISRPSMESSLSPSLNSDRRRSSSFWPAASSSSPMSSLSDADDLISQRPALPDLPRTNFPPSRKSLGDYYLSNPILRRKSSPMAVPRPRASPY